MVSPDNDYPVSKRRRLKRRLIGLVILMVIGLVAWLVISDQLGRPLREAIAEADRLDPGWRWEDLQARRATVPDDENALLHALDTYLLLWRGWPGWSTRIDSFKGSKPASVRILNSEVDLPCPVRLPAALATVFRTDMAVVAKPLAEAQKLASLRRGYLAPSSESFPSPPVLGLHDVSALLLHDAIWQAEQGQAASALLDLRAVLRLGNAFGDDPDYRAQCMRLLFAIKAMEVLERVLAQVSASEKELAELQAVLEETMDDDVLLTALRGERATQFTISKEELVKHVPARPVPPIFGDRERGLLLMLMNRAVENAKLAPGEQFEAFVQLDKESRSNLRTWLGRMQSSHVYVGYGVVWNATRLHFQRQAMTRTALVAIAAERFRLQNGRWPENLDELAPLIKRMPVDPFDGQPLRLKLQPDGLIIYSVSWDRKDADGLLNRNSPVRYGVDIGFQLWDVSARRQPAKAEAKGDGEP